MTQPLPSYLPDVGFRFARYLLLMGVILMPLLAYTDYINGYIVPALVKLLDFFICLIGFRLSKKIKYEHLVRLGAGIAMFAMSAIGAIYKLDSYYSLVWVPVLPAIFCFLSGMRIGIALSGLYLAIYSISYFSFNELHGREPVQFDVWIHTVLAYLVALLISVLFKTEIQKDEDYLKQVADLDYLTQVNNRRGFVPKMERELERAKRYQHAVSVILFDIDNFKRVNDLYGHAVGDKLLIEIVKLILPIIHSSDLIARWGGEEFIILTPESKLQATVDLAEKLRKEIERNIFAGAGQVSASFGVTEYRYHESWDSFVDRVDSQLYQAKNTGRNKVVYG